MIPALLSVFALALVARWIFRVVRDRTGWVLATLPASIAVYFLAHARAVASGDTFAASHPWAPGLGMSLSLYLDGLSLLFALLITGIGALVLIYSGGYLADHPQLGRFYCWILLFMGSMLGLVLADNAITLFVFWELTSLTSYLLIGFDHGREEARWAALQALLVTGVGGLALLAGLLLLGQAGGSLELSRLIQNGSLRDHPLYLPILLLILAGAFTKSAQAPFHFWLPAAMEAPTPVSAYLHSATMVKAGVYLLARLSSVLGGTEAWVQLVTTGGAVTMVYGAYLGFRETDLKRILAYSTVSALGLLTMLLGLGTKAAVQAAMVFLFAHALYKGALFLVAGALDHETGTRDISSLGGLRRAMPITAAAGVAAGLSMAGLPPLFGFISKEMVLEAVAVAPQLARPLTGATVAASALFVALAAIVAFRPFFGDILPTPNHPHEAPGSLWFGPAALSGLTLLAGLAPALVSSWIVSPAVQAVWRQPAPVELALWHGMNPALALSGIAFVVGLGLYVAREPLRRGAAWLRIIAWWGPDRWYDLTLQGLNGLARAQTRLLQNGYLRFYLITIVATTVGLVSYTLAGDAAFRLPEGWREVRFYEPALVVLMLLATLMAVRSRSRLGAVAALGVVGYGVALIFVLFGAPDLAMTQFLVETLTVILLVLVLYHLPRFATLSSRPARLRDIVVALSGGVLMGALVLAASSTQPQPRLTSYFASHSLPLAHGRNIVNVILVDFRALDTMGEITVLAVAAVGVYALLKLRLGKRAEP
jgi:multicomponent Na+:H+ antiporter subunit A